MLLLLHSTVLLHLMPIDKKCITQRIYLGAKNRPVYNAARTIVCPAVEYAPCSRHAAVLAHYIYRGPSYIHALYLRAKFKNGNAHTHEIMRGGVDFAWAATAKWENMVIWMHALKAKIGSDFELRASNYW